MADTIKTKGSDKEEVIDLTKKVTVYSTDANPHIPTGEAFEVHPKVAEKIIANGLAVEKAPKKEKEVKE